MISKNIFIAVLLIEALRMISLIVYLWKNQLVIFMIDLAKFYQDSEIRTNS